MNTTTNDITGDALRTRDVTDEYRNNWDKIFNKGVESHPPAPMENEDES